MLNLKEIKTRLVWLSLGLVMSIAIAKLIEQFEATLRANIILATFIPLVVYMSDAVGTQMEAIIIRELKDKKRFRFAHFMAKQSLIVIPVSVMISLGSFAIIYLIYSDVLLATTVSLALLFGVVSSLFTGAVLPYWFWREHKDPAEASGPIATVIQDLISVLVFLAIARAFY